MRHPIFFLALLINAVTAFSPATSPASRSKLFQVRTPLTRLNSATTKMSQGLAIPFFDKLPWNAQREKDRESRRLRREMAELHRQLGIVEGASYEEIVAATDRLIGLAGTDIKKKIKVEMAKDKIFQIQLNERLAGLADVSLDARSQSTIEKGNADDLMPEKKEEKEEDQRPPWLSEIIKKPDVKWRNRQIKIWNGMSLFGILVPTVLERLIILQISFLIGQLTFRGVPEAENGVNRFERKAPHKFTACWLGISLFLFTKSIVFTMTPKVVEQFKFSGMVTVPVENLMFMTFNMFLQPYKGTSST